MKNLPENELFSAYLDGELTADEQANVERLLATSPAARQLMDELRALSSTLQGLPTQKLPEDLTDQVLRLAERKILQEPAEPASPHADAEIEPLPSPWKGLGRRLLTPRNLIWPVLASAVAIMLMLMGDMGRRQPAVDHREVAVAPKEREPRKTPTEATMQAPDASRDKDTGDAALGAVAEKKSEKRALEKMSAAVADGTSRKGISDSAGNAAPQTAVMEQVASGGTPAATAPRPAATPAPVAPAASPEPKLDRVMTPPRSFAMKKTADSGEGGAAQMGQDQPQENTFGMATQRPAVAGGVQGKAGGGYRPMPGKPAQVQAHVTQDGQQDALAANGPAAAHRADQSHLTAGTTVVFCDVTAQAARNREFDRLLSRQQIVWEDFDSPADAEVADKLHEESAQEGRLDEPVAAQAEVAADDNADGEVDVVLVEAAPAQIEATLAALRARPSDFVTVCVAPAPNLADQQHWAQYNRSEVAKESLHEKSEAAPGAMAGGRGGGGAGGALSSLKQADAPATQEQTLGRAQRLALPAREVPLPIAGEAGAPSPTTGMSRGTSRAPAARPNAPVKTPAPMVETPSAERPEPSQVAETKPAELPAPKPKAEPEAPRQPASDYSVGGSVVGGMDQAPADDAFSREEQKRQTAGVAQGGLPTKVRHAGKGQQVDKNLPTKAEEMARTQPPQAATQRVLFVLRVVEPGDVATAAAAAAARARVSSVMAAEPQAPPAASIEAIRALPSAEAAPAPAAKH